MKWQDLLPKGCRADGKPKWGWASLSFCPFESSRWLQCGPAPGKLVIAPMRWDSRSRRAVCAFDAVIPEGTPLGQAVREIVTNPEGWPALLDLLLDDPEAGPHVRRLLEETQ